MKNRVPFESLLRSWMLLIHEQKVIGISVSSYDDKCACNKILDWSGYLESLREIINLIKINQFTLICKKCKEKKTRKLINLSHLKESILREINGEEPGI